MMNAEVFSEWLREQGYQVIRTSSSYWYEASPRVYQAFPYHWVIQPSEEELRDLLLQKRAVALRYSTCVEAHQGRISYHAIYDAPVYLLESLDRRSRQNIRKGLQTCSVEQISFERLAEEGWLLELDTQTRQGRKGKLNRDLWQRRCMAAGDLPGFEAWGALVDGSLAASLLSFQMDDCCELIAQQCHRNYLNVRVNNALAYIVTETMTKRSNIRSIFYTLQSLDAPPNVDEFKFRMGYIARPVRQRVAFHPWLEQFVNQLSYGFASRLQKRFPANEMLAKGQGMLRFYLQGKQSLHEQDWPDCLRGLKKEILKNTNSGLPAQ